MRRRVSLHIAGTAVDIDEQELILLTVQREDLYNPAVVLNSYSQRIALPGTPKNEELFGHCFRADRTAASGFDPSRRAAFSIFDELGRVLASGYAKMERILTSARVHTYEVSLFGSLGEFIYGLAYDADGNKKTLASLDYTGGGDTELDFNITKAAVLSAWARLAGDNTQPAMWDVINFAPCYNGIPDGDFDAGKALAVPGDVGLTAPQTKDGVSYGASPNGKTIITLPDKIDEWAAKDLRSYLQRPVLSMWAFLQAIADAANNGGWTVDLGDIDDVGKWPYRNTWLTRPQIPSLGSFNQQSGGITVTDSSAGVTSAPLLMTYNLADVPAGAEITFRASLELSLVLASNPGQTEMYGMQYQASNRTDIAVCFLQMVAYAADNTPVGTSPVWALGLYNNNFTPSAVAATLGYSPVIVSGVSTTWQRGVFQAWNGSGTTFKLYGTAALELTGRDISYVKVFATRYTMRYGTFNYNIYSHSSGATLYTTGSYLNGYGIAEVGAEMVSVSASAALSGSGGVRSGALITKQMLLNTDGTPADYLVALCKAFGLYILADGASKTAKILRRGTLYQNETIDLTERVDLSKEVELVPLAFDAKWYEFKHESAGGAFVKEYKQTEGVDYGVQRVDTNYDFDASVKDVLAGSVLRDCAAIRARSAFFIDSPVRSGTTLPPAFIRPGNKFTLWSSSNDGEDFDVPQYAGSTTPLNSFHPGYDVVIRPEFRDKEGKPVGGADVLLLLESLPTHYDNFAVTDDDTEMDTLNDGTPCWIFAENAAGEDVPTFSRYMTLTDLDGSCHVLDALDFGVPRQLDIPDLEYPANNTIYERAWKDFIHDRLDKDTKVLRCRVHLDGLQVGPELLRKFYFWAGSLWVLNKITNYSLTTFDPAECEFIQVRDTDAYLNGQYQ